MIYLQQVIYRIVKRRKCIETHESHPTSFLELFKSWDILNCEDKKMKSHVCISQIKSLYSEVYY